MNQQRKNKILDQQARLKAERLCMECMPRSHSNYHKFVNQTMKQLQSPEATRKKILNIFQTLSISLDAPKQTAYFESFSKFRKLAPAS